MAQRIAVRAMQANCGLSERRACGLSDPVSLDTGLTSDDGDQGGRYGEEGAEASDSARLPGAGVFLHPGTATPIRDDAWRNNVWTPMLRRAELRYRKPHTLRHTFASLLIEGGESLKYVQEQLGHHSPAFTLAVYGHLLPRGDRRAVDRLDDATERNPRATQPTESASLRNDSIQIHGEVSLPGH